MNKLPKFSCISKMSKHLPTHDKLQDHKKTRVRLKDITIEHHIQVTVPVPFMPYRKYSNQQIM